MTKSISELRVAIAHYWFVTWRGGEKVVRSLLDIFPNADVYTLFFDQATCGEALAGVQVHRSKIDNRFFRNRYQKIFPLYPYGVSSLKLAGDYDLLISSESGPIKGILKPDGLPHLCYIHTPMRYCWGFMDDYLRVLPGVLRPVAKVAFDRLASYDLTTVGNVDRYVANSLNVKQRVFQYYGRDADVVYPPISLDLFRDSNLVSNAASNRDYYLSFGAITPYKGVDLLVDAFNKSKRRLIVVGDGSERKRLESIAKSNVHFTGSLPYESISKLIIGAKALVFPGEEDFGMIPVEVMAHGVPVIALGRGGALESVSPYQSALSCGSGLFFQDKTIDSLEHALEYFESIQNDFDPFYIRSIARGFGEDVFRDRMTSVIGDFLGN